MRSIKELLELLLKYAETNDKYPGLCYLVMWYLDRDLTIDEYCLLIDYIKDNKPKWYSNPLTFYAYCANQGYYWPKYHKKPRIKWLKKHIKLNS